MRAELCVECVPLSPVTFTGCRIHCCPDPRRRMLIAASDQRCGRDRIDSRRLGCGRSYRYSVVRCRVDNNAHRNYVCLPEGLLRTCVRRSGVVRLIADVHGATAALKRIAELGGTLLLLGDLINFIDYRTYEGIITDVSGRGFTENLVRLRAAGDYEAVERLWQGFSGESKQQLRERYDKLIDSAYVDICSALAGVDVAYVTYGNVDHPSVMQKYLPARTHFIEADTIEIDGARVGLVGGGIITVGTPGEITEDQMANRLDSIGPVDILCTHVPPAIPALATDVLVGRTKGSVAVLDYLARARPSYHYFGDIHQGRATHWRYRATRCINVGYFRATGRAVHHG